MHGRYLRMPCDSISVFIWSLALQSSIYCAATPIADTNILSVFCLAHTAYVECEISMAGYISLSLSFSPFPLSLLFCLCEHNPQSADLATRPRLLLAIKANNTEQTNLVGLVNSNGHSCGSKQSPRLEARQDRERARAREREWNPFPSCGKQLKLCTKSANAGGITKLLF